MAVLEMWKPIDEARADLAIEVARGRKVNEMVAWLRAEYRSHGEDDPTREMVAGVLDAPGNWEALQAAVGRQGSPSETTRQMVLERFPKAGE